MKRLKVSLVLSVLFFQSLTGYSQTNPSPYTLRTNRELGLLGGGLLSLGVSLKLQKDLVPLTPAEVSGLNRQRINAFDRGATYHWSKTAGQLSDLGLLSTAGAVGVVAITPNALPAWKTVGVMYVETFLLVNGIDGIVKNYVQRTRPFVYNPAAPLDEKLTKDARQSFFSGHATNAFASAVFASEVFRHYYPNSRWKTVVWIGSLGLATGTAVLRYEAGKHYPTDLITGAAFGALVGWGIPKLHEAKTRYAGLKHLDIQPWSTGQTNGLYVRWTLK